MSHYFGPATSTEAAAADVLIPLIRTAATIGFAIARPDE
jgi:hypothetical protein